MITKTDRLLINRKRRWHQFHLWHAFLLLTVLLVVCGLIKRQTDFRAAKAKFYCAIQDNNLAELQRLLRAYPSLIQTRSPLLRVESEFSIYSSGDTPVWVAVRFESRDVFTYLMSLQPDVNGASDFGPPLITAALNEDVYYLRVLLEHGADPSIQDFNGKTALDYARQYRNDDRVKLLASHGR